MISEKGDALFRSKWRDLGYFCDFGEEHGRWRFAGSRSGLLKFCDLLNHYANDPANQKMIGEHEHYGPYMHLTIRTSDQPKILKCEIWGTITDIQRLAGLIRDQLKERNAGDTFVVGNEYADNNEYVLKFEIREDGFDPASIDPYFASNGLEPKQQ